MKKIVIVFLMLTGLQPAIAQSQRGDSTHLLWFTGHWSKTKKNVFITTATKDSTKSGVITSGGGSTITVNPDGSININSKGIDDWNKKIADGEKDLNKTLEKMNSSGNATQEWAYHYNEAAMPLLNGLKEEWSDMKINKKNDMLDPDKDQHNKASNGNTGLNDQADQVVKDCKEMQPGFQAIVDFYHAHAREKYNDLKNPAPPEYEYKCMSCDSADYKNYLDQCKRYTENFSEPEEGYIKDALAMIKRFSMLGEYSDLSGVTNVKNSPEIREKLDQAFKNSGPCGYIYQEDLNHIVQWLIQRLHERATKLIETYEGADQAYKVVTPVIRTFLAIEKQYTLLGGNADQSVVNKFSRNAYEHYYFALTEKNDWSQLANIPLIVSLYKQYTFLTGDAAGDGEIATNILNLLNSFELNIDMDVKAGKDGGYILTHLKGKAKITPEFKYGSDSCYEWVVIEDKPDASGQPVKKTNQKIELKLLTNEIITPSIRPTYTGSKEYATTLKHLKMDYCHPGKDTILLTGFLPDPDPLAGTWVYPHDPYPVNSGINGQDHYFQDINKMKEIAQSGVATQQANVIKGQSEKIAEQMKALAKQMNGSRDASQAGNYQKILNMSNQIKQLTSSSNVAPLIYIDFPLQIQNNNDILFKKRFDAKEINPEISNVIEHGYFTVDIGYHRKE